MNLTEEQNKIINSTPDPYCSLLVTAFAGTGKTFTLQKYAEERPADKILYSAYNKAIQLEAERKMPMNVSSRTTHSLAYRACAIEYQKKGLLRGYVPLWGVAKLLETNIVIANFSMKVVERFIASAAHEINDNHLTQEILDYYEGAEHRPPFVEMANVIWDSMRSLQPRSLPMTHDGYLKLYQLSGPELRFDYILLDEAQDTTPCVWDIMSNQHCRKIVVGDPSQAIYGFRGAVDALELVDVDERLYLSQSFRFGPEVADLASTLLQRFKGEKNSLRGFETLSTEVLTGQHPHKAAMLCRGNTHIFRASAAECQFGRRNLGFVGGDHTNYRFQTVLDAYYVSVGQSAMAKDTLIRSFNTFEDMLEYASKVKSQELEASCQLVEEFGSRIPIIFNEVKNRDVGSKFGDLIFATGHKSKGMEFPVVELGPDFTAMIEAHEAHPEQKIINKHEINLLYVAITRATEELHISPTIRDFINHGTIADIPTSNTEQ